MACRATPTATLYTTAASTSTVESFLPSVTTLPPVVTTLTTETCSPTAQGPHQTGCEPVEVAIVSTVFAGGPSTVQVPVQIVYEYTNLYATATLSASCSDPPPPAAVGSSSSNASSSTNSSSQQSSTTNSPTSTAYYTTVITPAPSVIVVSETTTASDGSTVYILTTYTSTFSPISALLPSSSGVADGSSSHHSNGSAVIGPVVGGILGGFFGLIAIVVLLWWLWRQRKYHMSRAPTPDLTPMSYRPGPTNFEESTERKPYHYGGLGSRNSHGSSRPTTPQARSSTYSQGNPPTTPRSMNRSSTRLSLAQSSGAQTPPFFASTAIAPGHSQPNSRPSTPGHFYAASGSSPPPPSAFARQSWPRYASDGEDSDGASPIMYGRRERRPSRLSLTLSMMDGTREGSEGAGRSRSASVKSGDVGRSPSMSTDAHHAPERSRSTLFVVNSEEPKNATLAIPSAKPSQSTSGHSEEARSLYARAG